MSTDELEILGHILIAAAKTENSYYPFIIDINSLQGDATFTQSWNGIVKDCERIAHNIPQPIRDIVGKHIQPKRDSNPVSLLPESFCQPDSFNAEISQTPRDASQSTSEGIPSNIRASSITGTERDSEEFVTSSLSQKLPSTRCPTAVKRASKRKQPLPRILLKDLKSWVETPEQFLNLEEINVDDYGIIPYIRAVENSQYLNTIRMRFVLRQLAESKRLWAPQTTKSFMEKLAAPRPTLYNWIYEGDNYSSLVAKKGPEVLFSRLKSRTHCRKHEKKTQPRGKKRSIDDLILGSNIESDVRNHHAKEANNPSLTFTPEELQLPKVYVDDETDEPVEVDENQVPIQELFKAAAEGVVALVEKLHRQAGLLLNDDESKNLQGPTDLTPSNDSASHVDQHLRQGPTERNHHNEKSRSPEVRGESIDCDAAILRNHEHDSTQAEMLRTTTDSGPGLHDSDMMGNFAPSARLHSLENFDQPILQQTGTQYQEASPQRLQSPSSTTIIGIACLPQAEMNYGMEASDNLASGGASRGQGSFQPQHANDLGFNGSQQEDPSMFWDMLETSNFGYTWQGFVDFDVSKPGLPALET